MTFDEIKSLDAQGVMQTYGRAQVAFSSGHGATLTDTCGREYIDFGSGIGVASLGYGNSDWVAAVTRQAATLQHTSNLYYNEPAAAAGASLSALAIKGNPLKHGARVFFSNSGAEANEGMIKLARKYSFDKYGAERYQIMTLKNSFHGRTVTTLAATGQDVFHNYFFPFTDGFVYAEPNMDGVKACSCGKVCAVMLECIQGEGGVLPLSKEFLAELSAYAAERDWLILVDEVQTGVGRTGTFFAFEQFGLAPDAVSMAKGLGGGLPIGAVIGFGKCADVLSAGMHASTFGANPVACAGASVVMEKVSSAEFLAEVTEKGDYLRKKLLENKRIPVREIRGLGLMLGVELAGIDAKTASAALLKNGLITLTAKTALRFLPPLVITREELDRAVEIMEETLA